MGQCSQANRVGWDAVADNANTNEDAGGAGPTLPAGAPADQPYQALYRRYRPQRFADVKGQDHVTRALRNAVREERVAHAYLFSGPRGTGKTSTARILAMALNCESPEGGEPDGTCSSCTAVRAGASMDVFELDAASNRKLDEMRDLLSRVALGTPGRWKVYIVDEVHQLTPDAASALLKTLEEPPSHVVFVLATTDPQKVLPTILSRTQHFEFHLLDGDLLTGLLSDINQDAGLGLSPDAVTLAVQRGRGSARDAESALEQLAAAGEGEDDTAPLSELVEALAQRDVDQTLQAVAKAVSSGKEPRRLGGDLVDYLRNAFLASQAPSLVLLPAASTAKLGEQAQQMGLAFLVRCMETVGQALVDMRDSVDPRVTLEVTLIRLASPATDASPAALLERLERLEKSLAEGGTGAATRAAPSSPGASSPPVGLAPSGPAGHTAVQAAAGAAPGKVALGAYLRGGPGPATLPSPEASPATLPPPARPEEAPSSAAMPTTLGTAHGAPGSTPGAPGSPGTPSSTPGTPGATPTTARTASGPSATAAPTAPGPATPAQLAPRPADNALAGDPRLGDLPSRDALTKAWGDTVLGRLDRRAQVYMGSGRFAEVSNGTAVFALPDPNMLDRATPFVGEAESALASHFGLRVPLRLVVDTGIVAPKPSARPTAQKSEVYDLDDLDELTEAPGLPAVPVEQRILEAFPGSVLDG